MIVHPYLTLLSQPFSRADLFLVVFCLIDEWMKQHYGISNRPRQHRGPRPNEISDSEVITLILVQEICQCPRESAWLRQVRANHPDLFPALPSDSRFNRRAQDVRFLLRELRAAILFWADADVEPIRIVDSFPTPLCECYRIRQSTQPISGSTFGYNDSKKKYFFGLHTLLLVTESGFIVDIALAPGNMHDTRLTAGYLDQCQELGENISGQQWVMDKGFWHPALTRKAKEVSGVNLNVRAPLYVTGKGEPISSFQRLIDKIRKPIENVISILTQCFGVQRMLVRSDCGIYRRVEAKATAFSLARYFNAVLGGHPMDIARYAV